MDEKRNQQKHITPMFALILEKIRTYKGSLEEHIELLEKFNKLNTTIFLILPELRPKKRQLLRHRARILRRIFNDKHKEIELKKELERNKGKNI